MPIRTEYAPNTEDMLLRGEDLLKRRGLVRTGDVVLMLAGQGHGKSATNMMRVHTVS